MSDETPPFFEHLPGLFAVTLLQIGRRTGLLDAVLADGGTAEEVGDRAGADHRNTAEWLRGMTVAGYLAHSDGHFRATDMTRMTFGPQFPVSAYAILDGLWGAPQVYDDVVAAVRSGAGIAGERLTPYAPFVGVNSPMYEMSLVADWIASVPGLSDTLKRGGRVAEIAPGNGAAAAVLGRAFPSSTVVGYDLSPQAMPDLPANVSIQRADARNLPDEGPFDLVYCLDSLHHIGDPASVLEGVRRALAPGGVVLVAENDLTGDLDQDAGNASALIALTSSLIYCLQEALAGGGAVHSCAEGPGWVVAAMEQAGFTGVTVHHSATGYAIVHAVA